MAQRRLKKAEQETVNTFADGAMSQLAAHLDAIERTVVSLATHVPDDLQSPAVREVMNGLGESLFRRFEAANLHSWTLPTKAD